MQDPVTADEQALQDIASRHGFGLTATRVMRDAVVRGHGSMAQFSHPEFGGSGQWMRGGMTMVSDMFNDAMKRSVDALCQDLAALVADLPDRSRPAGERWQSPGSEVSATGRAAVFRPATDWWPGEFGPPNASGSQNGARYAYFAGPCRLAVESGGKVTVYDTQDHRIGGVSQQQATGAGMSFTIQHGPVALAGLKVVSVSEDARSQTSPPLPAAPLADDVFAAIEKLASLRAREILTEEEFASKKAELLGRI